jgi:hypothetical protein
MERAVYGTVTDADTTEPIEGAEVLAEYYDADYDEWWWADGTYTDENGEYELYIRDAGEYRVSVKSRGYYADELMIAYNGSDALERNFALEPGEEATVLGTVTDATSALPIKGRVRVGTVLRRGRVVVGGLDPNRRDRRVRLYLPGVGTWQIRVQGTRLRARCCQHSLRRRPRNRAATSLSHRSIRWRRAS